MDLLDRLLGQDAATTRHHHLLSWGLGGEQLEHRFDIGHETPREKTCGGAVGHRLTHNMHHRGEVQHSPKRLGVAAIPEGDLLGREGRKRAACRMPSRRSSAARTRLLDTVR